MRGLRGLCPTNHDCYDASHTVRILPNILSRPIADNYDPLIPRLPSAHGSPTNSQRIVIMLRPRRHPAGLPVKDDERFARETRYSPAIRARRGVNIEYIPRIVSDESHSVLASLRRATRISRGSPGNCGIFGSPISCFARNDSWKRRVFIC